MEKKTYLLTNLKKQVIALKNQLETIDKNKYIKQSKEQDHSKNHQSITHSSRFQSVSLDCSDLDRGRKKFKQPKREFKNLAQIIREKSALMKTPNFSAYRRAEYEKTRKNFSSEEPSHSKTRSRTPNPITGVGYLNRKKGLKVDYEPRKVSKERVSGRRHFELNF